MAGLSTDASLCIDSLSRSQVPERSTGSDEQAVNCEMPVPQRTADQVGRSLFFLSPSQPFRLYQGETQLIKSQVSLFTVPDISQSLFGEVSETVK